MNKLIAKAQAVWATREQGASAVEYGLLVALIAAVIVVAVFALGSTVKGIFTSTSDAITPKSGS